MGFSRILPRFRKGAKEIRADDLNQIVDAVAALNDIVYNASGSAGLDVKVSSTGLMIALLGSLKDRILPVKITEAPAPDVAVLPSNCKYSYLGLDRAVKDSLVIPVYGRPIHADECAVYPAKVGDLAFIFRNPQDDGTKEAELWILTEVPARGPCP